MSIINKMLQDLDRRQAMSSPNATMAMPQVRTVSASRKDREWFWRIIAVLMIAAVGWVGWIAWQLQPRDPVVTPAAFKASQDALRHQPASTAAVEPKPVVQAPIAEKPVLAPQTDKPAPQAEEVLKPAWAIDTPVRAQPLKPVPRQQLLTQAVPAPAVPASAPVAPPPAKLDPAPPPERILQVAAQAQGPARVEKKDRSRTPEERAESDFRRGAALLNQGRGTEAEDAFGTAITVYPAHEAARQALVAVNLEYGRIDVARRLLQEGVALNPENPRFAAVLARIYMGRNDYAAALEVVNGVKMPELNGAELQSVRGSVLQKMGRHAEAADAFQISLRGTPQNGAAWLGLGISLDVLGRRPEAAESFRRAAATGMLGSEASSYAEQRARQLQ